MAPLPWKGFWSLYCFTLAVLIVGQLGLGYYMTRLDFYHPWYHAAPLLHKGMGLLIALLAVIRLGVRLMNGVPGIRDFIISLRYNIYGVQHLLFYGLILSAATAGFSFATSTGEPAPFFGLFDIPAPATLRKETGEIFDLAHTILVWALAALIALHSIEKMRIFIRRHRTGGKQ